MQEYFDITGNTSRDNPHICIGQSTVHKIYKIRADTNSQPVSVLSSGSWQPQTVTTAGTVWIAGTWLIAWTGTGGGRIVVDII